MDTNLMRYLTADMQAGIDDREPWFLNEFMDECPRCGFLHTKTWNSSGGYYDELVTERFCPACWHSWEVRVMVGDVGGDPAWDEDEISSADDGGWSCEACNGSGMSPSTPDMSCGWCHGTGAINVD